MESKNMSMPSFPPCGADLTKDKALAMIIASIATEELALSHIVNAEGEKLQYILGTLPGRHRPCASTQDILAVNQSAAEVLDTVIQSQKLLKGKLESALEACGHQPAPEPPWTCEPCRQKSAIHLVSQCGGFYWDNGFLMSWKCQGHRGQGILWNEENPARVNLDPGKTYALNYAINVRGSECGDCTGDVLVKITPHDAFSDVLPLHFSVKGPEGGPSTLHYSALLFPQACPESCAALSLLLNCEDSLFVEQASLNIFEV